MFKVACLLKHETLSQLLAQQVEKIIEQNSASSTNMELDRLKKPETLSVWGLWKGHDRREIFKKKTNIMNKYDDE